MGSFNPPDDAFDDADLENLEQASQAILTTLWRIVRPTLSPPTMP